MQTYFPDLLKCKPFAHLLKATKLGKQYSNFRMIFESS